MSEPFVGEVRMFAGGFAPVGWAFCDGQLLAVSQNDALFSLLGTIYGGDGRTTFALPDLRGRLPIHGGDFAGPGLSPRPIGSRGGTETETITNNQLPAHDHQWQASDVGADLASPIGNSLAQSQADVYRADLDNPGNLSSSATSQIGGSQSHTNLMPFLCVNFIIALFGIYPSRF